MEVPPAAGTSLVVHVTSSSTAVESIAVPGGDPFLDELVNQLFDNFFRSLAGAVKMVLEGSSIPVISLKRMLSLNIESIRVMVDDSRVERLIQLADRFVLDVERLRVLDHADLSLQIDEELNRLQILAQERRESASIQLAVLKEDLTRIDGNVVMTVAQTRHTAEQIEIHRKNILAAEEMVKRGQALHRQATAALSEEQGRLTGLSAMTSQLQAEAEARTKELAEVELRLAQDISLDEAALREQATAATTANHHLLLAASRATLLSYTERHL